MHGKLDFEDIIIKNGLPMCRKCQSVLEFGKVVPRKVEGKKEKTKPKKTRKNKR